MAWKPTTRSLFYLVSSAFFAFLLLHLIFDAPALHRSLTSDHKMLEGEKAAHQHLARPSHVSRRPASHLDLPKVTGARAAVLSFRSITQSSSAEDVELALYEDAALGTSSVRRVLIQVHGQGRDSWNSWTNAANARQVAASSGGGDFSAKDVLIVAPMFFNGYDKNLFRWTGKGSTGQLLVWKGNGWGEGEANQYPHRDNDVSSFEALDAMLLYYSDRDIFPHVESIVVSGHSLGGQFVHRYSTLSNLPLRHPVDLSFIVSNPSTLLYLDSARPRHDEDDDNDNDSRKTTTHRHAEGYNHYKYGLEGIRDALGEYYAGLGGVAHAGGLALWQRFVHERRVHYVSGAADHGVGDERPAAYAQGKDRVDRFKNYMAWASMEKRGGAWPRRHTVDWVPGVAHDERAILASEPGLKWAFFD